MKGVWNRRFLLALSVFPLLAAAAESAATDPAAVIAPIQSRWAVVQYTVPKDQQADQFAALAKQAAGITAMHPGMAEPLIWEGIVLASEAGADHGFGALSLVKQARSCLDRAVAINGNALAGSAYTTLGSLYSKVPDWPIGFGDKDKAEAYFRKALALNPAGIDDNYFYAQYLADRGDKGAAMQRLQLALRAPDRPGRALADRGRRDQIRALMAKLRD